jgi:hypothetical protein
MMAAQDVVRRAKDRVLAETSHESWFQAAAIARVGRDVGLLISVRRGARAEAQRFLDRLAIDVPFQIRELGPVRARTRS